MPTKLEKAHASNSSLHFSAPALWQFPNQPLKDKYIKEQKRKYATRRKAFLKANRWCAVELALTGKKVTATHIHHIKGRCDHLLDEDTWLPVTSGSDKWIHANMEEAKKRGWLA